MTSPSAPAGSRSSPGWWRAAPAGVPAGGDALRRLRGSNEALGGGLDRGTSTLIIGPAGAGKSVFCAEYATAAGHRGEPAIYFSFDEGLGTLVSRSEKLGMRMRARWSTPAGWK